MSAGAPSATSTHWRVREAVASDVAQISAAVRDLLAELGAAPALAGATHRAVENLLARPADAAFLLAEADSRTVGVLGASWQSAARIPGAYGLIQELWVAPDWRSRAIGRGLLEGFCKLARARGVARIEVVLPGEGFSHLAATEAFYLSNHFKRSGMRLRRAL